MINLATFYYIDYCSTSLKRPFRGFGLDRILDYHNESLEQFECSYKNPKNLPAAFKKPGRL